MHQRFLFAFMRAQEALNFQPVLFFLKPRLLWFRSELNAFISDKAICTLSVPLVQSLSSTPAWATALAFLRAQKSGTELKPMVRMTRRSGLIEGRPEDHRTII
jgi:hypothetical protein